MSLRRRKGLDRGPGPTPDPEKVRTWQQRSRERARQRQNDAPRRHQRRRKARVPADARKRVYRRSGGLCVRPGCGRRCAHLHHWLDESKFPHLAKVEDNMSGTCATCNWTHHFAPGGRLPWEAIPDVTHRLAEAAGTGAQAHLERFYPRSGGDRPGGPRNREEAT